MAPSVECACHATQNNNHVRSFHRSFADCRAIPAAAPDGGPRPAQLAGLGHRASSRASASLRCGPELVINTERVYVLPPRLMSGQPDIIYARRTAVLPALARRPLEHSVVEHAAAPIQS